MAFPSNRSSSVVGGAFRNAEAPTFTPVDRFDKQPIISVKRKAWRMDDEHAGVADAGFAQVRMTVLARDKDTCQFCGFFAKNWQEVHHKDDDHQNNDPDNLITICNACHLVHHVGLAAINGFAFISYVPELSQTEVNHLMRMLIIAKAEKPEEYTDKYESLLSIFKMRGFELFKKAGYSDTANIFNIARSLSETMSDAEFAQRLDRTHGLRVVPTEQAFSPDQIRFYIQRHSDSFKLNDNANLFNEFVTRLYEERA